MRTLPFGVGMSCLGGGNEFFKTKVKPGEKMPGGSSIHAIYAEK